MLNHCDRLSFAGCIYVFKYPKLRRELNRLILASSDIAEDGTQNLTKMEQEELAW